jgi:allantoate deiminase
VTDFDPIPIGERAEAMIEALAKISVAHDRLTRLYLTPQHKQAAELVGEWMVHAGMSVRMDAAASMRGFLPAGLDGARSSRRLLIGSHIDTVIDGGRYDGTLGVVAGILAVEEIHARGISLPFGLEIIAFGDEEGVRFPKTLIGSSTLSGVFDPSALDTTDYYGETLRDALIQFGCDPDALASEAYRSDEVVGYLEVHVEQGPILERSDEPLGVVTAIAGQSRHRVRIKGVAGHAGTVPMAHRQDALAGAAEFIAMVEEIAHQGEEHQLVVTVGEISVKPGAVNVIPGEALMSLDIRANSHKARAETFDTLTERAHRIGSRRGVDFDIETVHEKPVVLCSPRLRGAIGTAIEDLTGRKSLDLMSGAGHDGLAVTHLTDVGMIFVRCRDGISHNPLEHVSVYDMGYAVEALVGTILEIAREEAG